MNFAGGLILGSGMGPILEKLGGTSLHVPTRLGMAKGKAIELAPGVTILALSRHSSGHKVPPHHVNYGANALAMAKLGIRNCLASAAVGSLRPTLVPGTLGICGGMIDLTFRNTTLFTDTVQHTPINHPYSAKLQQLLLQSAQSNQVPIEQGLTYIGLNGPRYETPQEINWLSSIGGDVVGMTSSSEAIVFAETGIEYGCLAAITNLGAGLSEVAPNHEEVIENMNLMGQNLYTVVRSAFIELAKG